MGRNMMDADRQDILAFLSGSPDYAPASGEITGILKTMGDEMTADLKDAVAKEEEAVAAYEELMAAKKKEVNALTKMIEEKLTRIGDLGVEIQQMKNDLGDTGEGLEEDKKFLADLDKNCDEKQKLYEENVKYRTQEPAALFKLMSRHKLCDLAPSPSFRQRAASRTAGRNLTSSPLLFAERRLDLRKCSK